MIHIDHNLPPTHPHNLEACRLLKRKWSEVDRMYINADGSFPTGSEGNNDNRWGYISNQEAVHCHR